MRNFLLLTSLFFSAIVFGQGRFTQSYNGNGNTGFGGAIGEGTLSITDTPDSLIFTLQKGTGAFDSVLVIYLQGSDNPFLMNLSSNSSLPGDTDPYKAAIAGLNTTVGQRSVLNFPSTFMPNLAVAVDKNGGKLYAISIAGTLIDRGTFTTVPSGDASAPEFVVGAKKSDLGVSANPAFKFLGTYVGPFGSRSNEAFGDEFTGFTRTARTASYSSYSVTTFNIFASTLPVKLTSFKAAKEKDGVNISWSVAQETGIDSYDVQRAANGTAFNTIQTVKARNASGPTTYNVKDANPAVGSNQYRLAIRENGSYRYSDIVYIGADKGKGSFAANYRPGNVLTLSLNGITAGAYNVLVVNSTGQLVQSFTLQHTGSNTTETRTLQGNLSKGIYRVVLQSATEKHTAAIIVQ